MSVVGYNRNEMATLHIVKTCCLPAVCIDVEHGIWIEVTIIS